MRFEEERAGKLIEELETLRFQNQIPLNKWQIAKGAYPCLENGKAELLWKDFNPDSQWEKEEGYCCIRTIVILPTCYEGCQVQLKITTGREGEWDALNPQFTLFLNGERKQGIDVNHRSVILTRSGKQGESYEICLQIYGKYQNLPIYFKAQLESVDLETEKLYYDLLAPFQVGCLLEKEESAYRKVMGAVTGACNLLDLRKPGSESFFNSLRNAKDFLEESLYKEAEKEPESTVYCVGHTHIDLAWLWTLDVTRDKAVRSFSTVLNLMKEYPEYLFMSSQPALYQYVKEDAPDIYREIKKRVAEGRWEPEGGMFVEADCNITGGESLVRQCLYGIRFFEKEFGKKNEILWLPDVFGYSAALPQIMIKCGLQYFMTTKISWNETNKIPCDTFYWEGIDGSRVLTHFIPTRDYASPTRNRKTNQEHLSVFTTNYNGNITPSQVKGAWQRYQQKRLNSQVLMSYGYGDGGGGPTSEMLEMQRRLEKGIPGCPNTRQSTASEFFKELEKQIVGKKNIPLWNGELYLEYHRGVYTSMARNKRANRKSEFLLGRTELWSSVAKELLNVPYEKERLADCWEILLRNQFHDILPGSSIAQVYEDSKKEYEVLEENLLAIEEDRLNALTLQIKAQKDEVVVFNPHGFSNTDIVELPVSLCGEGKAFKWGEQIQIVQKNEDGTELFLAKDVPSMGYAVFSPIEIKEKINETSSFVMEGRQLETGFYKILFNEKGQFISIYDKEERREILKKGQTGNVLMSYEDKPHDYDAWNLYSYYQEKSWEVEELTHMEVIEKGPLRYGVSLRWNYLDSSIQQTIYFYSHTKRIDFKTEIDWKQQQIFLKALFPVDINSREGVFEIQYGNVKRDLSQNTSWDQARFEVCHQKWMDFSEDGYGVSFLNDCKYGISILDQVVGISLLKSGIYPNPYADQEHHVFTYSLYPHKEGWRQAETARMAYCLNQSMTARKKMFSGGSLPEQYSFVKVSAKNLMLETVKEAEDSQALIVRLYEYYNRRTKAEVIFPKKVKAVYSCNLLEEEEKLLEENTNICHVEVNPYEILTLKVFYCE